MIENNDDVLIIYKKSVERTALLAYSLLVIGVLFINKDLLVSFLIGALTGFLTFRIQIAGLLRFSKTPNRKTLVFSQFLRYAIILSVLVMSFIKQPSINPYIVFSSFVIFNIFIVFTRFFDRNS